MVSDLRTLVAKRLRLHPRVAYQGMFSDPEHAATLAAELPPLVPFRSEYFGAVTVVDWDHRLPSQALALRIYAYYTAETLEAGEEAFDDRLEEIGSRDRYPEFDVPDFEGLPADEAYEVELSLDGKAGRCRLTSAWRRNIASTEGKRAVTITKESTDYGQISKSITNRPTHLGDLEAVSWTPPCESQHHNWTIDVWYLLAFDGRVGTGRSFLVDLEESSVVAVRDFSVRTG